MSLLSHPSPRVLLFYAQTGLGYVDLFDLKPDRSTLGAVGAFASAGPALFHRNEMDGSRMPSPIDTAALVDEDSVIAVDWRAGRLFWYASMQSSSNQVVIEYQ